MTVTDERPTKPTRMLPEKHTAREYTDHLNMMLNYYIELSQWQEAQLAALQREHAASAAQRDARVAALERLASSEAFDVSRAIDPVRDKELLMRMEYAEAALAQPDAAPAEGEQS